MQAKAKRVSEASIGWLGFPAALALVFLAVPFAALAVRVHWTELPALLATEASQDALWLSLKTCLIATLLCLLTGAPLALWLARSEETWIARIVRTLVTLPMVLPPVVAGLALLITWGRMGLLGSRLHVLGIEIGFTTLAVIIAQTFVALPFMVTSLEGALRTRGFDYERAAKNLGASRTRTLFQVTLPLSAPALVSSTALAFSRCLGEFGATLTFAGSLQGVTRTLPLEVYLQRENDTDSALALSVVLIVLAIVLVGGTQVLSSAWLKRLHSPRPATRPEDEGAGSVPSGTGAGVGPDTNVDAGTNASTAGKADAPAAPGMRVRANLPERSVDLELEFAPGSVTALIGPNGAGKSTVLNLISGALRSSTSEVTWLDGAGRELPAAPKVVELAQNPALFPHITVLQNVVFALRCQRVPRAEAEAIAARQLEAVGVAWLARRRPGHLSGGQAQRVAIARALSINPEVVLLDEPMAALDVEVADQLRGLLRERIAGKTAVIVTHDLADAIALGAEVVLLRAGRVVRRGKWQEVVAAGQDRFLTQLAQGALLDRALGTNVTE